MQNSYKERLRRAKIKVANFISKNNMRTVYIGATSDVNQRFKNYTDMALREIIIKTRSYKYAKKFEHDLIDYAISKYSCCNKDSASRGLNPDADIYYIYLVADKSKCPYS